MGKTPARYLGAMILLRDPARVDIESTLCKSPEWIEAVGVNLGALSQTETWGLMQLSKGNPLKVTFPWWEATQITVENALKDDPTSERIGECLNQWAALAVPPGLHDAPQMSAARTGPTLDGPDRDLTLLEMARFRGWVTRAKAGLTRRTDAQRNLSSLRREAFYIALLVEVERNLRQLLSRFVDASATVALRHVVALQQRIRDTITRGGRKKNVIPSKKSFPAGVLQSMPRLCGSLEQKLDRRCREWSLRDDAQRTDAVPAR